MWFDATFDASIELKLQSGSVALTAQVIDSLGAASGSFVLGKTSKVSITGRAYATDLRVRAYYYYKSTNTDAEDSLGAVSDIQTDSVSMSPMSFARRLQAASPLESVLSDVKDSNMQVLRLT
jgi:hypothetical protein